MSYEVRIVCRECGDRSESGVALDEAKAIGA